MIKSPEKYPTRSTVALVLAPTADTDVDPSISSLTTTRLDTVAPALKSTTDDPPITSEPAPAAPTAVTSSTALVGGEVDVLSGAPPWPQTAKLAVPPASNGPPDAVVSSSLAAASGVYTAPKAVA